MDTLIFSQSAIFRLQQLGANYFRVTGKRFRLSDQDGILTLLKQSVLASDKSVRKAYDDFVMELNKRQIDGLSARGVKLRLPMSAEYLSAKAAG